MYAREYPQASGGAVRAFEDAYAKEEFLRRSAELAEYPSCTGRKPQESTFAQGETPEQNETSDSPAAPPSETDAREAFSKTSAAPAVKKESGSGGIKKFLDGMDTGDLLLILLIVFFLSDSDTENDTMIPILLAVLLLF